MTVLSNIAADTVADLQAVLDQHQPAGTDRGHVCRCGAPVLGLDRTKAWNHHRAVALADAGFAQTTRSTERLTA